MSSYRRAKMLSSRLRANSITSGFLVLPFLNSRQAENKFSTETICSKILPSKPPPNEIFVAPIIFHIQSLYREIYIIGTKIPKRDKTWISPQNKKEVIK